MKTIELGNTDLKSSRLIYGCMRIAGDYPEKQGVAALSAALDAGINHFDHADIYGRGQCEALFGKFLRDNPSLRDDIIITSKCGIRFRDDPNPGDPGRYDFSQKHITESVEGSLGRLNIEALDVLLLHRPDYLFDAAEVAETLTALKAKGKIQHFGVSNFSPSQVRLLTKYMDEAPLVNQVEINIHNISSMSDGTLDLCQELGITPQSWAPVAGIVRPALNNRFTPEDEQRIHAEINRQAERYNLEDWIVMLAWLLKHPAKICPILGTTNPERIHNAAKAIHVNYSREDWYRLLEARNGHPVP